MMNPNQRLWVRISHAGIVTEQVEIMDFRGAIQAIIESYTEHNGRKVMMNIEIANAPLNESLLSREQQAEQQLLANALDDPNEIIYEPDVTLRECNEAWASEEGQLMFRYQRAESRVGVDPEQLNAIKAAYESKYPRVAVHGPLWTI